MEKHNTDIDLIKVLESGVIHKNRPSFPTREVVIEESKN